MATVAKQPRITEITLASPSAGPFSVGFRLFDPDQLKVYVNGERRRDFTIAASYRDGFTDTATIALSTQVPAGSVIRILGNMRAGRGVNYLPTDPRVVQKINVELARVAAMVAELQRDADRSLRTFRENEPVILEPGRLVVAADDGFAMGPNVEDIQDAEQYASRAETALVEAEIAAGVSQAAAVAAGASAGASQNSASTAQTAAGASQTAAITAQAAAGAAEAAADVAVGVSASLPATVKSFGAVGDGVANDAAAFQSLINSLPATPGPHVINVPPGSYAGNMAALALGGRSIVWQQSGPVTYPGTQPVGWGANRPWLGDTRPWSVGGYGFARDTDTGTPRPTVDVRRNTTHTGGIYGNVHSALISFSQIRTNVGNFENAFTTVLEDQAVQAGNPSFCGLQSEARRKPAAAGSTAGLFGGNILARDETGLQSSLAGGGLIGLELNVRARGSDDANRRVILDILPKCHEQTGAMEAYAGIRIKGTTTGGMTVLKRGVSIEPGGGGSYTSRGVHVEASSEAFFAGGAPNAVLDSLVTNAATARLGSTRKTAGNLLGSLIISGYNAADTTRPYVNLTGAIVSSEVGSETGVASLNIMIGGTLSSGIAVNGSSPANPVLLRVADTVKSVTQGAADSGGAGFRVLRVAN